MGREGGREREKERASMGEKIERVRERKCDLCNLL